MKATMVTKDDLKTTLNDFKEEILAEIRPIGRAVDTDARTIINHESRISRVEKQLAVR